MHCSISRLAMVLTGLLSGAHLFAQLPASIDLADPANLDGAPALLLPSNRSLASGHGDLDSDGVDDLYLGDQFALGERGQLVVLHGRSPFRPTVPFTGTSVNGAVAFDQSSIAVVGGDFDGDGIEDAALGAHTAGAGQVYIVFGASDITGDTIDLATPITSQGGTLITGAAADDRAGRNLGVGDINGDGIDDLIVSASQADPGGRSGAGTVYVIYGSAGLHGSTIALATDTAVTRVHGAAAGDTLGFRSKAGDFDGDGIDDLILGAFDADPLARDQAGEIAIVYGSATLPGTTVDLSAGVGANGETRIYGTIDTARPNQIGVTLAVADIDGDGRADIATAANNASPQSRDLAGLVYVVYGASGLGGAVVDLNDAPGTHGETRIEGAATGDRAGLALTVSDLNGDGLGDVVIGAPLADPAARSDAGALHVVYGAPALPGTTIDLASDSDVAVSGGTANFQLGSENGEAGQLDFNGDGIADAVVVNNFFRPVLLFGSAGSATASARVLHQPGAAPQRDTALPGAPVMRLTLGFDGGDDGAGNASATDITIARSDGAITNLGNALKTDVANVRWSVVSNRTGFASADATVRYTVAEAFGILESSLTLYEAPALSGPWTAVATQSLDTAQNRIDATLASLGHLAIAGTLGDSDADGILDIDEGAFDTDSDGDGILNHFDTDSDNDTIPDGVEGTADVDLDGDPNFIDLDSDNDGVSDRLEVTFGTDPYDAGDVPALALGERLIWMLTALLTGMGFVLAVRSNRKAKELH